MLKSYVKSAPIKCELKKPFDNYFIKIIMHRYSNTIINKLTNSSTLKSYFLVLCFSTFMYKKRKIPMLKIKW